MHYFFIRVVVFTLSNISVGFYLLTAITQEFKRWISTVWHIKILGRCHCYCGAERNKDFNIVLTTFYDTIINNKLQNVLNLAVNLQF